MKEPEIEFLAYNKGWTEGPVWNSEEEALYYSDVISDVIYRWTEKDGEKVVLKKAGGHNPLGFGNIPDYEKRLMPGPNGLAIREGWLYIC